MREDEVNFRVRIPRSLHEALRALAEREDRSINAQIVQCLRRCTREVEASGSSASAPHP